MALDPETRKNNKALLDGLTLRMAKSFTTSFITILSLAIVPTIRITTDNLYYIAPCLLLYCFTILTKWSFSVKEIGLIIDNKIQSPTQT